MDIIYLEREKRIAAQALSSLPVRLSSMNSKKCYKFLKENADKDVLEILAVITKAANHVKSKYHRELIKDITYITLAACHRNDEYAKTASDALSVLCDKKIEIKVKKKFNIIQQKLTNIILTVAHAMVMQKRRFAENTSVYLSDCGNEAISFIHTITLDAMNNNISEKECKKLKLFFSVGLYLAYLDTAYRDVFFWILDKIARKEIKSIIKPYVKPPHEWYPNIWIDSKALTRKLHQEGKIPGYEHSIVERRMVPSKQEFDLKQGLKY